MPLNKITFGLCLLLLALSGSALRTDPSPAIPFTLYVYAIPESVELIQFSGTMTKPGDSQIHEQIVSVKDGNACLKLTAEPGQYTFLIHVEKSSEFTKGDFLLSIYVTVKPTEYPLIFFAIIDAGRPPIASMELHITGLEKQTGDLYAMWICPDWDASATYRVPVTAEGNTVVFFPYMPSFADSLICVAHDINGNGIIEPNEPRIPSLQNTDPFPKPETVPVSKEITAIITGGGEYAMRVDMQNGYTQLARLNLNLYGLRNNNGKVRFALFNSPDGFPGQMDKAAAVFTAVIESGKVRAEIPHIPFGQYAIAILHDENNNGQLDEGLDGNPLEGSGASGETGSVNSFEEARFEINEPFAYPDLYLHY